MRATISYRIDDPSVPDDVKLGDRFLFTATAVVTGLKTELVDVTRMGRTTPEYAEGEGSATLTLVDVKVEREA